MFEFLFKYPSSVFTRGRWVLLGRWPWWALVMLIALAGVGLAGLLVLRLRRGEVAPKLRGWRGWALWGLQTGLVTLLLVVLWEPAVSVAELQSQQNMIAVVLDDSRSMGIADSGAETREAAAVGVLRAGVLAGLQKRFQTRLYALDGGLRPLAELGNGAAATGSATHLSEGLGELARGTADLPVGAIVLLTDGADNTGGVSRATLDALRNRRIPVHAIGFGREQAGRDVEMDEVGLAQHAAVDSRMVATVSFHQHGYKGSRVALTVGDGAKTVATREVVLGGDGGIQTETIFFSAGNAGAKSFTFGMAPLAGEENRANNAMSRLVNVSDARRRILYIEGEPRWEYKFIRRAEDDDKTVQIVSMLRTTENKIYRQGIADPKELAEGFPVRAEDLFAYDGIIVGSVEAGYFSAGQQELLREFANRRGGGVLFLGGRSSLADGGWGASGAADLMPTFLPAGRGTYHRDPATATLTAAGAESAMLRLEDDPARNAERWRKLTYMMDYQEAGGPKPGATVLAQLHAGSRTLPLLVTENYGFGRTAVLATAGTWRWQMSQPLGDRAHDQFWQQMLRWLVAESPGRVVASAGTQNLQDEGRMELAATVRDKEYVAAGDAHVTARVIGPGGVGGVVELAAVPDSAGEFRGEWTATKPGDYLAEVVAVKGKEELGRDVVTFRRTDGVAENFHTEQNRGLLERLAADTGGRYWKASEAGRLAEEISYSEAGISVRNTKELWNMPIVFLVALGLAAGEWMLRREWGIV